MNRAITDGFALMPPPFAAGLAQWSSEDGLAGQSTYLNQANAALIPADQDFGGALQLQKTQAVQKLRCTLKTPMRPGMYLQVTIRIKAVSGAFPAVSVAGWPGKQNGGLVSGVATSGPPVQLNTYGKVVEIKAIIGAGDRGGVTLAWGAQAYFAHFGLNLTGPNGGIVRIDDIEIEDVTGIYLRDIMDMVDVRDFGAKGNGTVDDSAAFEAADEAANGRSLIVPSGTYLIGKNLTIENPIRFQGKIKQAASFRFVMMRNYDLDTYTSAFESELAGLKKALQALFYFTDHVAFDMSGRRVDLTEPLNISALAGLNTFSQRRVLQNGQLNAAAGAAWDTTSTTSVASYDPNQPTTLTNVINVFSIPVGAQVIGNGVGREVYVLARNFAARTLTLSQPIWGGAGTRTLTFKRYKYLLDFSGFTDLSRFVMNQMDFQCNGIASGVMLPTSGITLEINNCLFNRPKDRAITSTGLGCQGLTVDSCQFWSNEQNANVQDRTTIALNVNANDAKIRDNRVVRFAHFAVVNGGGHLILGNHFFQGDNARSGVRRAGLILSRRHPRLTFSGNYVDNCWIELSNEHDAYPNYTSGESFNGISISGNHFFATDPSSAFRWIVVAPKGSGHFLEGVNISNNTFRAINHIVDRAEGVDTTNGTLNYAGFKNVTFASNAFHNVTQVAMSPLVIEHQQNTASTTWLINASGFMPFGSYARNTVSVMANGPVTSATGTAIFAVPYALNEQGSGRNQVQLRWGSNVKGKVLATILCDNPS